jgi:hypothetical protein
VIDGSMEQHTAVRVAQIVVRGRVDDEPGETHRHCD